MSTRIEVVSGIDNISPTRILCYPNPANTQVMIQLEGLSAEPLIIFDVYGRIVFETEWRSNKYLVNTESFTEGTYIIQCGNKHEKLVVKH